MNGTSALHVALLSVGVREGDFVLTTPFSFIASSNAILYCGAIPYFVDIDPKTYCMDIQELALADVKFFELGKEIKCVLPVHLFGNTCDMKGIRELMGQSSYIVEDCAQALGARVNGTHVGNFGDIGTFSFYASKNLWTFEGGMIITNNEELATKARMLINHGCKPGEKYKHYILGYNYRMPQICALLGLTSLKLHKKGILAELGSYGIDDGYYPEVIYNQPLYKKLGIKGNCPIAEKIAEEVKKKLIPHSCGSCSHWKVDKRGCDQFDFGTAEIFHYYKNADKQCEHYDQKITNK